MLLAFSENILRLRRRHKLMLVMLSDALLACITSYMAFFLRLESWSVPLQPLAIYAAFAVIVALPILAHSGIYLSVVRFTGTKSLWSIVSALFAFVALGVVFFAILRIPGVPRTIPLIQATLFLPALILSRMAAQFLLMEMTVKRDYEGPLRRAMIYGAGDTAQKLAQSLRDEPGVLVTCFIDSDKQLLGQKLNGIQVFDPEDLEQLIESLTITDLCLAEPEMTRQGRRVIIDRLENFRVRVKTIPNMKKLIDGDISYMKLRAIDVQDLLGRAPVAPQAHLMDRTIAGKTVLVSGAGGSIGSELCRQIVAIGPKKLILADISEFSLYRIEGELREALSFEQHRTPIEIIPEICNMADRHVVDRLFERWQPDTVYHAAAYKHVPLLELNSVAGTRNNVLSTMNSVAAAKKYGTRHYILISTDKAVRPTSVMGTSKRVCELVLQAMSADENCATCFSMVRFGNVLGSSGSVVPRFEQQIAEGGPITLTHKDITRYFMTIPEASQLVIQAAGMASGGEVYVLDMGEPVKIIDLARSMIRLSGKTEKSSANPNGDIEIAEIGLRSGEKLYEELLIGNSPERTEHELIMRAKEDMIPAERLLPLLDRLILATERGDRDGVIGHLCELVPEYCGMQSHKYQNSA